MAKKNKSTKKKIQSRNTIEEEHLETLIKFSRRAITNQNSGIDEFFSYQTEKLEKRLEELRRTK